jgi:HlyD family secretion protein
VGMSADAEVVLEERKNILVIPEGAVHYEQQKTFVHVQETALEEGFRKVEITKGISDGIRTESLTGLQEGEVVILQQ